MEPTSSLELSSGESAQSAVSWGAIIAGALAASTLTAILMLVGSGIGLAIVSPWPGHGAGLTAFAATTAVGMIIIQWLSSGVGGYLAGRLRTKWVGVRSEEVFFRDTVHGFLAWAAATLLVFGILGTGLMSAGNTSAEAVSTVAAETLSGAGSEMAEDDDSQALVNYLVDTLLRADAPAKVSENNSDRTRVTSEVSRILVQNAASEKMDAQDRAYLARLIAANADISEADAASRVDTVFADVQEAKVKAREAADSVRKAGAAFAIVSALALLIGAFVASTAAAIAGRQRDEEDGL